MVSTWRPVGVRSARCRPGTRTRGEPGVAGYPERRALAPEPLALGRIDIAEEFLDVPDLRVDVAVDHEEEDSPPDMPFSTDDWQWLGDFLKRRGLPGMAIAVNHGGRARLHPRVGWAELRKRAIDEDTLFELGSIGKTFTAVLAVEPPRPHRAADRLPAVVRGSVGLRADSRRASAHALGRAHSRRGHDRRLPLRRLGAPRHRDRVRARRALLLLQRRLPHPRLRARGGDREAVSRAPGEPRILEPMGLEQTEPDNHCRHPRPDGGGLRPAARRPHAFAGRPALPGAVARNGHGRRLARLDRGRPGGVRRRALDGAREDTHLGPTARLRRRVELRLRARAQGGARPSRRLDARLRLDVARRSRVGNRRGRAHERARRARRHGGRRTVRPRPPPWRGSGARPATPSRGLPTARPPSRSPSTPRSTAATGATTPGCPAFASSSGRAGSRLRWPGETTSRSPGSARPSSASVASEWSPERLRFDAFVDEQALRANLSGESYYRSDFR